MSQYINGPTNFAYLKGTINGITKNIYLFSDNHYPLDEQTRCQSFDSIDISQYLYNLIKNTKVPLDFFAEIRQSEINSPLTDKRDIYIKEINEMFKSEFIVEKINDKDTVKYSKSNPYVRLHYLDVRDHFDLFYITDMIKYDIFEAFDLIFKNIGDKKENLNKILEYIQNIEYLLNKFNKNIKEIVIIPKEKYDKIDKQKYYFNKIINKYENNELKKNINNFIDIHVSHLMHNLTRYIDELKPYIKKYDEKYNNKIKECNQHIYDSSIDIYSLLTDAYLLRRILDKNYIKKSIVYSGSQHSINCIFFLIKYYGFKIIKIHDSSEKDTDILMDNILNTKHVFDIYKFFNMNDRKKQCIDYEILRDGGNKILYD